MSLGLENYERGRERDEERWETQGKYGIFGDYADLSGVHRHVAENAHIFNSENNKYKNKEN